MPLPPGGDGPTGTHNPFEFVNPCFLEQPRPAPAAEVFACPRFMAENSMYAPNSFVFQLDSDFNPTYSVRDERINACMTVAEPPSLEFYACRIGS